MAAPPFSTIFFDCDSTLSRVEGIDELGYRHGRGSELAHLTNLAMNGQLPLDAIYQQRMEMIKPHREDIEWLGRRYVDSIVEGGRESVRMLHRLGKQVHIISSGLRQAIYALAHHLDIPDECVHAVDIYFDASGNYHGFDERSPLAAAGGKPAICRRVLANGDTAALVGDGANDLEARTAGVFVVGFGGVAARPQMRSGADVFIGGPSLYSALDVLLTPQELTMIADMNGAGA